MLSICGPCVGALLGSLNFNQKSASSPRRQRRYIEEAELFNIEVNYHYFITDNIFLSFNVTKAIISPSTHQPWQVLLAVDYSVLLFHGRDHIQKYLLTFMNIVSVRSGGSVDSREKVVFAFCSDDWSYKTIRTSFQNSSHKKSRSVL